MNHLLKPLFFVSLKNFVGMDLSWYQRDKMSGSVFCKPGINFAFTSMLKLADMKASSLKHELRYLSQALPELMAMTAAWLSSLT